MTDRPVMTVIFVYRVTSSRIVLYVRCFMIDICMWIPDAFILAFPSHRYVQRESRSLLVQVTVIFRTYVYLMC
jgi:hypothetical protein